MSEETASGATTKSGWKGWLALFMIFVGLPIAAASLIWRDRCKDSLISTMSSADQAFSAVTTVRDCGPAMKPATIVTLRSGTSSEEVLILHGETPVDLRWEEARQLSIGLPKERVIVKKTLAWRDLTIILN